MTPIMCHFCRARPATGLSLDLDFNAQFSCGASPSCDFMFATIDDLEAWFGAAA